MAERSNDWWQLDQAILDALEANRPESQIHRLRSIRDRIDDTPVAAPLSMDETTAMSDAAERHLAKLLNSGDEYSGPIHTEMAQEIQRLRSRVTSLERERAEANENNDAMRVILVGRMKEIEQLRAARAASDQGER